MKSRNLFFGILILFAGIVALLGTLDVISLSWHIVLRLWPMLLILLGIAILPINNYVKSGLLVLVLGMGCLLYHHEAKCHPEHYTWSNFWNGHGLALFDDDDDDVDDDDAQGPYLQTFSEPYETYQHAMLDVKFGAGDFAIKKPCAELVSVKSDSDFVKYNFRTEKTDDQANIYVAGKGTAKDIRGKVNNELEIALNDEPLWTINIETGASDCDFDFSSYKIKKLSIEAGVSDMDIRLGDQDSDIEMFLESGVSDIEIDVPATMGCKIIIDSGLANKDFVGFDKLDKGIYQTPNFGMTEHQIVINLDCGVSDIEVKTY